MKKFIGILMLVGICTYAGAASMEENLEVLEKITPSKNARIVSGYKNAKEGVQTVFTYDEDSMYTIYCRVNYLTTIMLQPGETITFVGGGDTARWRRATAETGSSEGSREVIYIKPTSIDLKTNLVINTTKRNYQINLISDKTLYNPIIKWQYPQDQFIQQINAKKLLSEKEAREEKIIDPTSLNYNYTLSTNKYNFSPEQVFNDKTKTYILLKEELQEMPSLYIKEGKNLLLVNYRKKGNYLIVDRLFDEAELRIENKKVIIKRKK